MKHAPIDTSMATARPVTAREVIHRIQASAAERGFDWVTDTVDTFKSGDPDRGIRAIATTWMATTDVIRAAVDAGCDLLITHEPTFWNHLDARPDGDLTDTTFVEKARLLDESGMVVWRFHDHHHSAFDRDPVLAAFFSALGWSDATSGNSIASITDVDSTVRDIAASVQASLATANVRVIGDPGLKVSKVGYGAHTLASCLGALDDADVVIVGEVREWDTFEYFRDLATLGYQKALIVVAHRELESRGSDSLAPWVAELVPEVPVESIVAVEPFSVLLA